MRDITPISQIGARVNQHGRIRLGVKTATAMKAIDTFRFTSPDAYAIAEIAALYGGEPSLWDESRAAVKGQWQVTTKAKEIHIYLPPNAIDAWYECWSGGGLLRQCDGVTCYLPGPDGMSPVACMCDMKKKMECKVQTRMQVILPEIRFGGVWRLDTKGWNATQELPAMEQAIRSLQQSGLLDAQLRLEQREKVSGGKKKSFVVPVLGLATSPLALLGGMGVVGNGPALASASAPVETLALPPAEEDVEDDIEDATVPDVPDRDADLKALVERHPRLGLDVGGMEHALEATASAKQIHPTQLAQMVLTGQVQIVTVNAEGILRLRKGR